MPTIMHGLYSALAILVVIAMVGGTLYLANPDESHRVQRALKRVQRANKPPATRYVTRLRGQVRQRGRGSRR